MAKEELKPIGVSRYTVTESGNVIKSEELKCECRRCIHSDCSCYPSDYGKDRNGICDHFKDVFDEVVELKDQLTKAKEILKKYHYECPAKYSFEDIDDMAEQFLNGGVEK